MDRVQRLRGRSKPVNERARPADEETPLVSNGDVVHVDYDDTAGDAHKQFCLLVGITPTDLPTHAPAPPSSKHKLYERAKAKRRAQGTIYQATALISNALLLAQIILGAVLTALGASGADHLLITIFGVLNTVIAGVVAYIKSRGQPMRARMFLDDLDSVVAAIEDAEITWLGVSRGAHGYDELDTDDKLSVRSEVARLTHMYNHAVESYIKNNPDNVQGQDGPGAQGPLVGRPEGGKGGVFGSGPHGGGGAGAAAATETAEAADDAGGNDESNLRTDQPATAAAGADAAPAKASGGAATAAGPSGSAPPKSAGGKSDATGTTAN